MGHMTGDAPEYRFEPGALYLPDTEGHDLRPDPDAIRSVPELLEALRRYRTWAGNPPFRLLATRCCQRVVASTFCETLKGTELPRLAVVRDLVGACGCTAEYQVQFERAWRRLRVSKAS